MSAVLARQLTFLLAERRRQYRALQWRTIVPVKTGIPEWAESLEVLKLSEQGNEPVPHKLGNQKAPVPSYDRTSGTLTLVEFALMYQIFDSELLKAEKTGINVSAQKVLANQRSAEEFLDKMASMGDSRYGIKGILRCSDVAPTVVTTPIHDMTVDEICEMFGNLIFKVSEDTKQLHAANQVVMPDNTYRHLGLRMDDSGRSALSIIREQNPGVDFKPWYRCRTAGGTTTLTEVSTGKYEDVGDAQRIMAFDSSNDVVEMPIVHELRDGEPLRIHGGYEVLQDLKFGAPIVYQPAAIAYLDGDFSGVES